jgi:hypothetical protein
MAIHNNLAQDFPFPKFLNSEGSVYRSPWDRSARRAILTKNHAGTLPCPGVEFEPTTPVYNRQKADLRAFHLESTTVEYCTNKCSLPLFVCLFSWRYNPFGCIFQSPVAGFSLLILEVS